MTIARAGLTSAAFRWAPDLPISNFRALKSANRQFLTTKKFVAEQVLRLQNCERVDREAAEDVAIVLQAGMQCKRKKGGGPFFTTGTGEKNQIDFIPNSARRLWLKATEFWRSLIHPSLNSWVAVPARGFLVISSFQGDRRRGTLENPTNPFTILEPNIRGSTNLMQFRNVV